MAVDDTQSTKANTPLCVDLDGTLIRSDLLVESALALLSRKPWALLLMVGWLLRGKAYLKKQIALRVEVDATTLPYNQEILAWLAEQRTHRQIVLCTASDIKLATLVATHAAVFDDVIASNGDINLSGDNKARALIERFGDKGFDYVGNALVDLAVWKHAHHALVVESGHALSAAAAGVTTVERRFEVKRGTARTWLKALRVHQWVKNVLVFLPLLAAHRVFQLEAVASSLLAFLCFGLTASSVYVTNDLLDLPSDRVHHRKRRRPFAAGTLPLIAGPIAAIVLLVIGFGLACAVSAQFVGVLAGYYVLTTAYSIRLKRMMMLDVIVLATLYTTRILAGAAAIGTPPSFWLLAFSMFVFLSLAMVKRYTELLTMQANGKVKASGRGYDVDDIPLIQSMGSSSGYIAVLVLALYVDSTASSTLYRHPHYLWLICPLMLYWMSRTWAIAHRGVMHDDPVVFAVMDNVSRVIGLLMTLIVAAAI